MVLTSVPSKPYPISEVTWGSALLGLLSGALAGTGLSVIWRLSYLWELRGVKSFVAWTIEAACLSGLLLFPVWTMGLAILAGVPWLVLRRIRRGSALALIAVSAGLAALGQICYFGIAFGHLQNGGFSVADGGGPTWLNGALTPHGWQTAIVSAITSGAMVGAATFVAWRVSHRKLLGS